MSDARVKSDDWPTDKLKDLRVDYERDGLQTVVDLIDIIVEDREFVLAKIVRESRLAFHYGLNKALQKIGAAKSHCSRQGMYDTCQVLEDCEDAIIAEKKRMQGDWDTADEMARQPKEARTTDE